MKYTRILLICIFSLTLWSSTSFVQAENTVPDGLLVKSKTNPRVFYIENNTKRPIESPAMLESRFSWENLIVTSQSDVDSIPNGRAMTFRDGSILSYGGTVYVVSDGMRRPIESAQAFLSLGFSWGNVRAVSKSELDAHPQGGLLRLGDWHPDGVLLQSPQDAMFVIDDGKRRYIPSPLIFESQFRWQEAVKVSSEVLNRYPQGQNMLYPDGLLIASATSVYIMDDNVKRPISSPEVFESYGLNWRQVRRATDFEHSIIPVGTMFTKVRTYPDGTLIQSDDSNLVYRFQGGQIQEAITPNLLRTQELSKDAVLTFPRRVVSRYTAGSTYRFRNGSLVSFDGAVFLIQNGQRRAFVSPRAFTMMGNKWEDVLAASPEEIQRHTRGTDILHVATANLDGYQIPATSGPTAREQHLAIDCNETAQEHYSRAGILNASPSWLRNGLLNSGGAFATECPEGSRNFSAGNFSVEEEKYYITMRWNFVDWFEPTSQVAQPLSGTDTQIVLKDASRFPNVGFVIINGEIIGYSSKNGNTLTVDSRGVDSPHVASAPKAHGQNSTVQEVYEFRSDTWRGRTRTSLRSDTDASKRWHRGRKVLVTNPATGKSVVTAIMESGPAIWTNRVSGLSPEAMHAIGADVNTHLEYGFLVEQNVPLGPID
jgi:hypothetical protein